MCWIKVRNLEWRRRKIEEIKVELGMKKEKEVNIIEKEKIVEKDNMSMREDINERLWEKIEERRRKMNRS